MAKRYSLEWKLNLSNALKKHYTNNPVKEETKKKLSDAGKKGNRIRIYKIKDINELKSSKQIRIRLLKVRGEKCEECGWHEINSHYNILPLQIHHIDGDSENNTENNLKILCPNCHSLSKFFMCFGRNPKSRNNRTIKRYKNIGELYRRDLSSLQGD